MKINLNHSITIPAEVSIGKLMPHTLDGHKLEFNKEAMETILDANSHLNIEKIGKELIEKVICVACYLSYLEQTGDRVECLDEFCANYPDIVKATNMDYSQYEGNA